MGGGAGSGGGGGNGAGDGDGSGPGSGNGSGDGAGGAGNGAAGCGGGSPGACTNCGHNVTAGDPVDVTSGRVITVPKSDLYLPGPFNLQLMRQYSSGSRRVDLGIGYGWYHSLSWRLEERRDEVVIWTGDGKRITAPRIERPGDESLCGAWAIMRTQDFYAVRPATEFVHWFRRRDSDPNVWDLVAVTYRDRGKFSLEWDRGRLARVVDAAGRVVVFESDAAGRTTSIHVPTPTGDTLVFATYAYDGEGNLVAARDADGALTTYAYDELHQLTRMEHPNGLVVHFVYDADHRCVETWADYPDGRNPGLAEDLPDTLADGRTRAKGIYHTILEFGPDGYSEVTNSRGTQRFFAGRDETVGKAVDARGGTTTRTLGDDGRVGGATDANGANWTFQHDSLGAVVAELDPEGRRISIRRDGGGREIELTDPAGGRVIFERDRAGEITSMTDQVGAVTLVERGRHALPVTVADDRGGRRRYEYDQHGNATRFTTATGGTFEFTYDWWGRCLSESDPLGNVRRYQHARSGRIVSMTDALGQVTTFQYDAMGNLTRQQNPDGSVEEASYVGLNWQWLQRRPDGSEVRVAHDREGYVVRIWNEKGERYEIERGPTGLILSETDFIGRRTKYKYDSIGHIASISQGKETTRYERDRLGRVVAEEASDGSKRTYQYDARGELIQATNGKVSVSWERDAAGKILAEHLRVDGASYRVDNARSRTGDLVELRTSLGHDIRLERDAAGMVTEVWAGSRRALAIVRDPRGAPAARELRDGARLATQFDELYRLKERRVDPPEDRRGMSSDEPAYLGERSAVRYAFGYTSVDEVSTVWRPDGSVEYKYDVRHHVLSERKNGTLTAEFAANGVDDYFEQGKDARARVYGPGSRLDSMGDFDFVYDAHGRLREKVHRSPNGRHEVTKFDWDGWGLLRAVETHDGTKVEFEYDPFARRLAKRVYRKRKLVERHHYVWNLMSVLHDVSVGVASEPQAVQTYLFDEENRLEPIAQDSGDGWLYHLTDVNGAPLELVDGRGRSAARFDRTVFGVLSARPGAAATTPFRFSGQWADEETGLHYNRYRYYDPDAGRYISPDPTYVDGGLNFYAYGPNPVAWVDPMGWARTHLTTVRGMNPEDARHAARAQGPIIGYNSSTRPPVCPQVLSSASGHLSHSEQTFCYDVLRSGRRGGNYQLDGTRPPCPNCHGAMMRTAAATGSTISYSWPGNPPTPGGNTITYHPTGAGGTPVQPTFTGSEATGLRDGRDGATPGRYSDITLRPSATVEGGPGWTRPATAPSGPAQTNSSDLWGVNQPDGSTANYRRFNPP